MLITPESSDEHDLLLRRLRSLRYVLGLDVAITILRNGIKLTLKPVSSGTSDQTRAD